MFCNYKIKDNILYLYVDYSCEIGSLFSNEEDTNIISNIKKYIKDKKIKFNGYKVILLLSGIMLGTVYLNKNNNTNYDVYKDKNYVYNIVDKSSYKAGENKDLDDIIESNEEVKEYVVNNGIVTKKNNANNNTKANTNINKNSNITTNSNISNNNSTNVNTTTNNSNVSSVKTNDIITLYRKNGEVLKLDINEYLIGVVAAEMPASFNIEALKAQSLAARTYTYKLIDYKKTITDEVGVQVYNSNYELKGIWGSSYDKYYNKIKTAVLSTENEVIIYNNTLIDAVYHSTSNGYTEDSVNVWNNSYPYLKSVVSPWDTSSSSFKRETLIDYNNISKILGFTVDKLSTVVILQRNESNRISKLSFNDRVYTGVEIRNLLGLRSADFDIELKDAGIMFTTRGYGHGVGMSQYGANGMANAGYDYKQIINYYYTNVVIKSIKNI